MSASSKLRFVTWNILAPCYNRSQGSLEKNYPLRYVPRLSSIFATLQQMQADVICLQEFWFRQEVVSLAAFASQPQVLFNFKNITAKGNNIYIDNINIDVAAGINEQGLSNTTVTLSPNPVGDVSVMTVNTTLKNHSNIQLQVYNVLGEKVKTILPASKNKLTFEIKKSDFNAGIFMYELVDGNSGVYKGKFVVE